MRSDANDSTTTLRDSIMRLDAATSLLLTVVRFLFTGKSHSEAFGNEFGLALTGLAGHGLLHELSAANTLAAARLEFTHVLAITLDLFLLGVRSAREQRRNRHTRGKGRPRGKTLVKVSKGATVRHGTAFRSRWGDGLSECDAATCLTSARAKIRAKRRANRIIMVLTTAFRG